MPSCEQLFWLERPGVRVAHRKSTYPGSADAHIVYLPGALIKQYKALNPFPYYRPCLWPRANPPPARRAEEQHDRWVVVATCAGCHLTPQSSPRTLPSTCPGAGEKATAVELVATQQLHCNAYSLEYTGHGDSPYDFLECTFEGCNRLLGTSPRACTSWS